MNDDTVILRPWGSFAVLHRGEGFLLKQLTVLPGQQLSLQYHRLRSEHWVVVHGMALARCGDTEILLRKDQSVFIPAGAVHRLRNAGEEVLQLVEVQTGLGFDEDDIVRLADDYGRASAPLLPGALLGNPPGAEDAQRHGSDDDASTNQ